MLTPHCATKGATYPNFMFLLIYVVVLCLSACLCIPTWQLAQPVCIMLCYGQHNYSSARTTGRQPLIFPSFMSFPYSLNSENQHKALTPHYRAKSVINLMEHVYIPLPLLTRLKFMTICANSPKFVQRV